MQQIFQVRTDKPSALIAGVILRAAKADTNDDLTVIVAKIAVTGVPPSPGDRPPVAAQAAGRSSKEAEAAEAAEAKKRYDISGRYTPRNRQELNQLTALVEHKVSTTALSLQSDEIKAQHMIMEDAIEHILDSLPQATIQNDVLMLFVYDELKSAMVGLYRKCDDKRTQLIKAAETRDKGVEIEGTGTVKTKALELQWGLAMTVGAYREDKWTTMPIHFSLSGTPAIWETATATVLDKWMQSGVVTEQRREECQQELSIFLEFSARFFWTLVCMIPRWDLFVPKILDNFDDDTMRTPESQKNLARYVNCTPNSTIAFQGQACHGSCVSWTCPQENDPFQSLCAC